MKQFSLLIALVIISSFLAGCGGGGGLAPGGTPATSLGPNGKLVLSFPWPGSSGKTGQSKSSIWLFAGTLQIEVSGDGLPQPLLATISQQDVVNGEVTLTFDNVPPGKKEVDVYVFTPDGLLIGHRTQTVSVAGDTNISMTVGVTVFDGLIFPDVFPILLGDSALWVNSGTQTHRLVGNKNEFDSGLLDPGKSYSFAPAQGGEIFYHCSLHPNETGALFVLDPNAPAPGAPPAAPPQQGPNILTLSPNSGPTGTTVTINGALFGDPQGTSLVYFQPSNGAPVSAGVALSWLDSEIQVHVPEGLPAGAVSVFVDKGGVLSNTFPFTVTGAAAPVPQIMTIFPTSGNPLTEVIISGSGFGNNQGTVLFGGSPGTVGDWTDTQIRAFPPNFANSSTMQVQVVTGMTTSNGVNFDYLAQYQGSVLISPLSSAWAIALGPSETIYVSSPFLPSKISKYDATGTLMGGWGSAGTISPAPDCFGLALDTLGNLFFTVNGPGEIKKYDVTGANLLGSGPLMQAPLGEGGAYGAGVALDSSGGVWVCDKANGAVEKYTWDGSNYVIANQATDRLAGFPTSPDGGPMGVSTGNGPGAGYVYVTDTSADAVKRYLTDGTDTGPFISGVDAPLAPRAIAVSSSGHILVTETEAGAITIKIYEPNGSLVKQFQINLYYIFNGQLGGIAVDKLGNIYAVDSGPPSSVWKFTPYASLPPPLSRQRH